MFHFSGTALGLCTWDPGVHFKPIEIQRQSSGLQIPAVRLADTLFQTKQYVAAADLYHELATNMPDRLEGLEARLKFGMCMAKLKRPDEARRTFRALRKSPLEPFALTEEAQLDFTQKPSDNPLRGLKVFEILRARHPDANTNAMINAQYQGQLNTARTVYCQYQVELGRLAADGSPVWMSTIRAQVLRILFLMELGKWNEALQVAVAYRRRLDRRQYCICDFDYSLAAAAIACGRFDLAPPKYDTFRAWMLMNINWTLPPVIHLMLRRNDVRNLQRAISKVRIEEGKRNYHCNIVSAAIALAQRRLAAAARLIKNGIAALERYQGREGLHCSLAVSSGSTELYQSTLAALDARATDADERVMNAMLRMQWHIQRREFSLAAAVCEETPAVCKNKSALMLKAFLVSVGALREDRRALLKTCEHELAGVQQDLARMFLGRRAAQPGKLWPHPLYRPELRLWLGLWLEEKGRVAQARAIVKPARDPRFGLTNFQPAIEAFMKRTARR
jgi:hypothetical protein